MKTDILNLGFIQSYKIKNLTVNIAFLHNFTIATEYVWYEIFLFLW